MAWRRTRLAVIFKTSPVEDARSWWLGTGTHQLVAIGSTDTQSLYRAVFVKATRAM